MKSKIKTKRNVLALLFANAAILSLCACGKVNESAENSSQISSAAPAITASQESGLLDEIISPVEVKPGTYQTISTDGSSYFVIKNDDSLWGWGGNFNGQLGIGTNTDIYGPQQMEPVLVMENVEAVSTWGDGSGSHTLIVKTDGTLWACGSNGCGQLGIGAADDEIHPAPIYIMDDVIFAYAKAGNSFAIKSDHSLWAWGGNGLGELGNGSTEPQLSPMKVLDDVASISASGFCTLAVKTDGTLWAWGSNHFGAIIEDSTVPVKIMDDVTAVCVGDVCSAIKTDGTLWAWGNYLHTDPTSPIYIMDNAAAMSPDGSDGGYVLKNDGTLWRWNTYSQIFYYTSDKQPHLWDGAEEPEDQLKDLAAIDGGSFGIKMILKSDGTLLEWGENTPAIDNIRISHTPELS